MNIILITSNLFTSYLIDVELLKVRCLLRDTGIKLKKTEDALLALNEDLRAIVSSSVDLITSST
jgi:hypothetical protein